MQIFLIFQKYSRTVIIKYVYISEYVYNKFGKTDDNSKLFRGAVRTKCNNAKKVTSATATVDK